jgi:hypothetical protein
MHQLWKSPGALGKNGEGEEKIGKESKKFAQWIKPRPETA